jgi:hypothetical protein
MKTYDQKSLDLYSNQIEEAKNMWRLRCEEYFDKHGDVGTCVLGAGIAVHFLSDVKKISKVLIIISQHDVSHAQGSVVWEDGVGEVVYYLNKLGLDCYYFAGRMD